MSTWSGGVFLLLNERSTQLAAAEKGEVSVTSARQEVGGEVGDDFENAAI